MIDHHQRMEDLLETLKLVPQYNGPTQSNLEDVAERVFLNMLDQPSQLVKIYFYYYHGDDAIRQMFPAIVIALDFEKRTWNMALVLDGLESHCDDEELSALFESWWPTVT